MCIWNQQLVSSICISIKICSQYINHIIPLPLCLPYLFPAGGPRAGVGAEDDGIGAEKKENMLKNLFYFGSLDLWIPNLWTRWIT